jgi:hypothetical protein
MNKLLRTILAVSTALGALAISTPSQAMSNYARQTGQACSSCHFQHYPLLNEFGRAFKAGGFTLGGKLGLLDGAEGLSLPEVLNAGLVTKIRYQKSNGPTVAGSDTTNNGQLQFPDELLLMLGGRVSENIGAQIDLSLNNNAAGTAVTGSSHVVDGMKMPFIYDVAGMKAGVIPFTTAGQGVSYGFELLNTGAVRGQRAVEARKTYSAQQYINTGSAAQGIALVASNPQFFANLSKWSPRSVGDKTGSPDATYFRLAATPSLGDWDLGVGLQSWSGSATNNALTAVDTKAWAIDAQAQGKIGAMPLGVYLTHAKADGSPAVGTKNFFNANINAMTATTVAAELGVLPGKATVTLAYRKGDNGKATLNGDNALMIGGPYQIVQNVQLQLNHESYSGSAYNGTPANGDQLTTLMLFASF